MLKKLFSEQQSHLAYYFEQIDPARVESIVNACAETKGLLIFTGVGKSGIIAEKIAMTLISTGTKALYLPATNFLHGDIGIVSCDDMVVMLSKSGETEELVSLMPYVQKRGAKIMAWVSNLQSRLAIQADLSILLPVEKELCPFDLAPTISTEVQLLFGDVLAVALMKKKGFTIGSYGENHPSGMIGKKATITVKELMVPLNKLPLCKPSKVLQEILSEFSDKRLGCVIITDDKGLFQGIFTDGDLRRALQSHGPSVLEKKLEDLMTRTAITTDSNEMAWDALKMMQKDPTRWIMMLPVLEDRQIVGLVRMHDIIHAGIA
ncbi:MAG: KpsF/GutQ family sugar-phosphate isomerase [Rhabdochlamydiaceae bacterium]|nr:KpsF/GutQ family sugar-phosphate isomerase [Rhabdochlamydiaceae bacterium]